MVAMVYLTIETIVVLGQIVEATTSGINQDVTNVELNMAV